MEVEAFTKSDLLFLKKLINKNLLEEDFYNSVKQGGISEQQLSAILCNLRREKGFRAFKGVIGSEPTICCSDEYIKQNAYTDEIYTVESNLKVIFSADAHMGHILDCIQGKRNHMEMMLEFADEQSIRHVVFLGDLIEGVDYSAFHKSVYEQCLKIRPDREAQIEYVDKYLPKMNKTTFHFLAGNHDSFSYNNITYDFAKDLMEKCGRDDIKIVGFDKTDLKINNDRIKLIHNYKSFSSKPTDPYFQFSGGSHITKVKKYKNMYLRQVVPPLCRIQKKDKCIIGDKEVPFFSGFLVVTFSFSPYKKIVGERVDYYRFDNDYNKPVCFYTEERGVTRKLRKMRD